MFSQLNNKIKQRKADKLAIKTAENLEESHRKYKKFNRFTRVLGPGIVTGAADDDPSGIATYSQAGAMYGFKLLWLFPVMFPLLFAVQETCARIGAVTGDGLAEIIKRNYSKKMLYAAVLLVVVANTVNIGADLAAMAMTLQMFLPAISTSLLSIIFAIVCVVLQIAVPYKHYAKFLKWLAIALFAYPVVAFMVGQDWLTVLKGTLTPSFTFDKEMLYIIVGIIGTTISPYLFFWNTSEVVEDEIEQKRIRHSSTNAKPRISRRFMKNIRLDNIIGMGLAVVSAWFIVITCASTLHVNGVFTITEASDAAKALEPLVHGLPYAGVLAKVLFSVGIIGTGLLAVPVLAGSSSYAVSETLGLKEGYYRTFNKARGFYLIIAFATLAGLVINFLHINPFQALIFTAVFNAVAAIPLLWMIWRVANNTAIMGEYKNGKWSNLGIWCAFGLMLAATLVLLYSVIFR